MPNKQTLTCFPAHLFFVESCLLPWCIAVCPRSVHVLRCLERFSQSSWTPAHPSPDRRVSLLHFHRYSKQNASAVGETKALSGGKSECFVPVSSICFPDKMKLSVRRSGWTRGGLVLTGRRWIRLEIQANTWKGQEKKAQLSRLLRLVMTSDSVILLCKTSRSQLKFDGRSALLLTWSIIPYLTGPPRRASSKRSLDELPWMAAIKLHNSVVLC